MVSPSGPLTQQIDLMSNEQVVLVECFAGICPMALAFVQLFPNVVKHIMLEVAEAAIAVTQHHFPEALLLGDIKLVQVSNLAQEIKQCPPAAIVLIGGPPCVDVSPLKAERSGAFGPESGVREHFKSIYQGLKSTVPNKIAAVMECTPMDSSDRVAYDSVFGSSPYELCCKWWLPITRKRWFWLNFTPSFGLEVKLTKLPNGIIQISFHDGAFPHLTPFNECLESGWWPVALSASPGRPESSFKFSRLTRHIPRNSPMSEARGFRSMIVQPEKRWRDDNFTQSPYQYMDNNCVHPLSKDKRGNIRRLVAREEEKISGFPEDYTRPARSVTGKDPKALERTRKSLWVTHGLFLKPNSG